MNFKTVKKWSAILSVDYDLIYRFFWIINFSMMVVAARLIHVAMLHLKCDGNRVAQ